MHFSRNAINVITRVLHEFQIKVKWVFFFYSDTIHCGLKNVVTRTKISRQLPKQHVTLSKLWSEPAFPRREGDSLAARKTTFLNTNAGRLGLFDFNAWLWQHGILLIMQSKIHDKNVPGCNNHRDFHKLGLYVGPGLMQKARWRRFVLIPEQAFWMIDSLKSLTLWHIQFQILLIRP